jgi:uncharacterized protein (TIGR02271 family)
MTGQCVVAVYESRNEAEGAYRAIVGSGIPADHVRLGSAESSQQEQSGSTIWEWLFGSDVSDEDRRRYNTQLSRGGTALSVLVDAPSVANIDAVEELMEQFHPVNVHEETISSADAPSAASTPRAQSQQAEQVVPLPEEELKVGKRRTERVNRIRTYVVEEPVEKDVSLRDERTIIEKRPASGRATGAPVGREYEIRETHEEPIVQKETRAGEELVVRKEATERTERVADTVKKTKADVERGRR